MVGLSEPQVSSTWNGQSYGYDDAGRVEWSTIQNVPNQFIDGNGITYYVYDESGMSGTVPVLELDQDGDVLAANYSGPDGWRERYMFGTDSSGTQSPNTFCTDLDGYTDYLTYDPQGNLAQRLRSDPTLQTAGLHQTGPLAPWLLDTTEYDAWGNLLADVDGIWQEYGDTDSSGAVKPFESSSLNNPVGFGGQWGYRTDPDSGLVLAGHRNYQPTMRRWLNRDPIGYSGGINLYGYCGNDPVNEADPSGFDDDGDPTQQVPSSTRQMYKQAVSNFVAQPQFQPGSPERQKYANFVEGNAVFGTGAAGYAMATGKDPIGGQQISGGNRFMVGLVFMLGLVHIHLAQNAVKAATNDYRATFFAANPHLNPSDWEVHHAIPQVACDKFHLFTKAEINSLSNLRGVSKSTYGWVHNSITTEWSRYFKANPIPTRQGIIDQANMIDQKYGGNFNPFH